MVKALTAQLTKGGIREAGDAAMAAAASQYKAAYRLALMGSAEGVEELLQAIATAVAQ